MWNKEQIKGYEEASKLLNNIVQAAFMYIKSNKSVHEHDVQEFILNKFKEYNLRSDKYPPIVAFNKNTSKTHHFPNKNSKKLNKNSLILIDVWAKINKKKAPFADITKMAYCGVLPEEIFEAFNSIIKVRERAIKHINSQLNKNIIPSGKEIFLIIKKHMLSTIYYNDINLYAGHSLGTFSSHGKYRGLNKHNESKLRKNLGYSLEPGIYIKNKFGVRSETNFYIDKNNKLRTDNKRQFSITKIF